MQIKRITILLALFFLLTACSLGKSSNPQLISLYSEQNELMPPINNQHSDSIKVAIASVVSPKESLSKYDLLIKYLEKELDAPIDVFQRQTYEEVNDMLARGEVDFAFICSLSYVLGMLEGDMIGVAAPEIEGSPFYRSYVITKNDSTYESLDDLVGKRFAFTDPLSYTGRLAVLSMLEKKHVSAEDYFSNVYYTYSHDNSIKAVAMGVVDGAAVDGVLFEQLRKLNNELVSQLKIIETGKEAGTPPIVASQKTDMKLINDFKNVILNLENDQEGQVILNEIGIDRYVQLNDENYYVIEESLHLLGE